MRASLTQSCGGGPALRLHPAQAPGWSITCSSPDTVHSARCSSAMHCCTERTSFRPYGVTGTRVVIARSSQITVPARSAPHAGRTRSTRAPGCPRPAGSRTMCWAPAKSSSRRARPAPPWGRTCKSEPRVSNPGQPCPGSWRAVPLLSNPALTVVCQAAIQQTGSTAIALSEPGCMSATWEIECKYR